MWWRDASALRTHGAHHRKGACCPARPFHDARRSRKHGIPHLRARLRERFKEAVIDRFADSYMAGETRCLVSNATSRQGFAICCHRRELGARVLATGHYVASRRCPHGAARLYQARDSERDRSYFLFATNPSSSIRSVPAG